MVRVHKSVFWMRAKPSDIRRMLLVSDLTEMAACLDTFSYSLKIVHRYVFLKALQVRNKP